MFLFCAKNSNISLDSSNDKSKFFNFIDFIILTIDGEKKLQKMLLKINKIESLKSFIGVQKFNKMKKYKKAL